MQGNDFVTSLMTTRGVRNAGVSQLATGKIGSLRPIVLRNYPGNRFAAIGDINLARFCGLCGCIRPSVRAARGW